MVSSARDCAPRRVQTRDGLRGPNTDDELRQSWPRLGYHPNNRQLNRVHAWSVNGHQVRPRRWLVCMRVDLKRRKYDGTQKDATRDLTLSCCQAMAQAHKAARKAELLRANEFHELSTSLQVPHADREKERPGSGVDEAHEGGRERQ